LNPVDSAAPDSESHCAVGLSRSFISAALFSFYALALVVTPYWMVSESRTERIIFLLITILLGLLWTRLASNQVQFQVDHRAWISAAILLLLVGALNFRALVSAIPWRGDESYHIAVALRLAQMVPPAWAAAAMVILALILYISWRKPKYALASCALLVAGCIGVYLLRQPPPLSGILRYPFVSRWFQALAPALLGPIVGVHHEILFRLLPFFSGVILSWQFSRSVSPRSTTLAIALGLAAATIPELFYYSSLLFLEMPAVVLMFLVCVNIEQLLTLSFNDLTKSPSWYALILIGFIKETVVPFLLCFMVYRMIIQLSSSASRASWKRLVRDELFMAVCTFLPLAIYLFFRVYFGNPRTFDFTPANLLNLHAISVTLLSHLQQFGLAYLLFVGGMVLLFRTKQYRKAVFLLLIIIGVPVFHLLDTVKYAGYSRFNLFILPAVLAGSAVFIQFIGTKKKWLLPALIGLMIATNLALTPVNLDGTKKPSWGNPGESYYPFPEALSWLKDHHPSTLIVFAGLNFEYYFDFYFDKLNWHPQYELLKDFRADEVNSYYQALQTASDQGSTCVIVRVDENPATPPQLPRADQQWQLKVFRNMAHSLLVYIRE
jgi:hypothetical protein